MITNVKSYKSTSVNWGKSQTQILKLLESEKIKDARFTSISQETAERSGMDILEGHSALMIEFMKSVNFGGISGRVPVRIIVPNIPEEDKSRNQAYRILFWYLKTKFEAVNTGLVEFEQEFMPHIALGKTNAWGEFKDKVLPKIIGGGNPSMGLLSPPKE